MNKLKPQKSAKMPNKCFKTKDFFCKSGFTPGYFFDTCVFSKAQILLHVQQLIQYGIFNDVRAVCDNIYPIQNTCN